MIFSLQDGKHLYQWDRERVLLVLDDEVDQVHFTSDAVASAIVKDVYINDGVRVVDIPTVLLQCACILTAYAYKCEGEEREYTFVHEEFKIIARKQPDDYVPVAEHDKWEDLKAEVIQALEDAKAAADKAAESEIVSSEIINDELIITYADGSQVNLGNVKGEKGDPGEVDYTVLENYALKDHTHDAPSWDELKSKPETFPPAEHEHNEYLSATDGTLKVDNVELEGGVNIGKSAAEGVTAPKMFVGCMPEEQGVGVAAVFAGTAVIAEAEDTGKLYITNTDGVVISSNKNKTEVKNLATPVDDGDATPKSYVDEAIESCLDEAKTELNTTTDLMRQEMSDMESLIYDEIDALREEVENGPSDGGGDDFMAKDNPVGTGSFSMNRKANTTVGGYSHTEGDKNTASGSYSHAEGNYTTASQMCSHAEGYYTTAKGLSAHAEGSSTTASGQNSHAEGNSTKAPGIQAHAEGDSTTASGQTSHAEGVSTEAKGNYSHTEGRYTTATGECSHAQGKYNISDAQLAHIVGNGSGTSARSNAHTLDWNGNAWFAGEVYVGSTSGTNKDDGSKKLATEERVQELIASSGGGGTADAVEWSNVQNKPFETVGGDTLTWDGNTEGLEYISLDGDVVALYHVSNATPTVEDLDKGYALSFQYGNTVNTSYQDTGAGFIILSSDFAGIIVYEEAVGVDLDGIIFPKSGIYFVNIDMEAESDYANKLTINGYTGFTKETIKQEVLPEPVLTSPSGKKFKITVADDGTLAATEV